MIFRNKKSQEGISGTGVVVGILILLVVAAIIFALIHNNSINVNKASSYVFSALNAFNANCDYDHDGIVNPNDRCKCDSDADPSSRIYYVKGTKGSDCPVYQRFSAKAVQFQLDDIAYLDGQNNRQPVEPSEAEMFVYVVDNLAAKKDCVKSIKSLATDLRLSTTTMCQYSNNDLSAFQSDYIEKDRVGFTTNPMYTTLSGFVSQEFTDANTNWILVLPQRCAENLLSLKVESEGSTADNRLFFNCKTPDSVCDGLLPKEKC
jgi:hypothetical protein